MVWVLLVVAVVAYVLVHLVRHRGAPRSELTSTLDVEPSKQRTTKTKAALHAANDLLSKRDR